MFYIPDTSIKPSILPNINVRVVAIIVSPCLLGNISRVIVNNREAPINSIM